MYGAPDARRCVRDRALVGGEPGRLHGVTEAGNWKVNLGPEVTLIEPVRLKKIRESDPKNCRRFGQHFTAVGTSDKTAPGELARHMRSRPIG